MTSIVAEAPLEKSANNADNNSEHEEDKPSSDENAGDDDEWSDDDDDNDDGDDGGEGAMPMLGNYKVTRAPAPKENSSEEPDSSPADKGEQGEKIEDVGEAERKGKGKKTDVAGTSAAATQADVPTASNAGPEHDGRRRRRPSNLFPEEATATKTHNELVGEAIGDALDEWFRLHPGKSLKDSRHAQAVPEEAAPEAPAPAPAAPAAAPATPAAPAPINIIGTDGRGNQAPIATPAAPRTPREPPTAPTAMT